MVLVHGKPTDPSPSTDIKDYIRYFLTITGFDNEYVRFLSYLKIHPPEDNLHLRALYNDFFSSNVYLSDLVDTYAKYYTLEEIRQLIQFYSSPLGHKVNRFNRILNQHMEDLMLTKISDYIFTAVEYGYPITVPEFY